MDMEASLKLLRKNNYTESTVSEQFDNIQKRPCSMQSKETSLANLHMMRNM